MAKHTKCVHCGRGAIQAGGLSRRGKCSDCALAAMLHAGVDMASKTGVHYERWRTAMVASVGRLAAGSQGASQPNGQDDATNG